MSTVQGAAFGGEGAREFGAHEWRRGEWRGACGGFRWKPLEIVAMVLGFIVFWPIGLAILGFKIWQRKSGYQGDLATVAQEKWQEARGAVRSQQWGGGRGFGFYGRATGNAAFDEWRATEISRLEEERRKLHEAHREFSEFVDNIRKAKDREEFERFMNERRSRPSDTPQGPSA
jgi:hypothetical protein